VHIAVNVASNPRAHNERGGSPTPSMTRLPRRPQSRQRSVGA
jgi:hypothetical protein